MMHVPDNRFANRITGVANDRVFGDLRPHALNRDPERASAHIVVCAMPVGDITTRHALGTFYALEPGTNIVGNVLKLPLVSRQRRAPRACQRNEEGSFRNAVLEVLPKTTNLFSE